MKDDFRRTAETFMADARTLHGSGRHRNACYLAGYVVECTLKALIEASSRGAVVHTHDLLSLRERLTELSLLAGQSVAKYGDPLQFAPTITRRRPPPPSSGSRMKQFCDWDPGHRYDGSRWGDAAKSSAYVAEAERALSILNQLLLDGGIR
ncbi:HEPN domain-containing protein [Sorangium sp. So ce1151]|uniref:HEPN domain-containing protein n=1 Tax=Sorangium sp. So ce1151 TaxID=3133332 RepID=UPI003F611934